MPRAVQKHCPRGHAAFTGSRCPVCARLAKAAFEARRPSSDARGYTSKWREARAAFLQHHPRCACGSHASAVDHIIPHKGDKALFWDRSNWQPMCKRCHDRKTATEDGGFGRPGGGSKVGMEGRNRPMGAARNLGDMGFYRSGVK